MKTITITLEQNIKLIDKAQEHGYPSSYTYIRKVFNGNKKSTDNSNEYEITFNNDLDTTWFLLNL